MSVATVKKCSGAVALATKCAGKVALLKKCGATAGCPCDNRWILGAPYFDVRSDGAEDPTSNTEINRWVFLQSGNMTSYPPGPSPGNGMGGTRTVTGTRPGTYTITYSGGDVQTCDIGSATGVMFSGAVDDFLLVCAPTDTLHADLVTSTATWPFYPFATFEAVSSVDIYVPTNCIFFNSNTNNLSSGPTRTIHRGGNSMQVDNAGTVTGTVGTTYNLARSGSGGDCIPRSVLAAAGLLVGNILTFKYAYLCCGTGWVVLDNPTVYCCSHAPCACPCGSWPPGSWPCGGLNQTYTPSITFVISEWLQANGGCSGPPSVATQTYTITPTLTATGGSCTWQGTASGTFNGSSFSVIVTLQLDTSACVWRLDINITLGGGLGNVAINATSATPPGTYTPLFPAFCSQLGFGYVNPFNWLQAQITAASI